MNILRFLPGPWQLALYAGAAVAIVGGVSVAVGAFIHHERMIGWNGALAHVAEQDAHARAIAQRAENDVMTCERNGGSFDVSTGDCSH